MDASALLKSQGWRGKGYSLHPTNNNIGLSKPILVSRNTDGRGIGQKPHVTSDTWWLDAFDQKLKGLDTSKKGLVTQSVEKGKLDVIVTDGKNGKYTGAAGLYASFVRGGMLEGTLTPATETSTSSTTDATPVSSSSSSSEDESTTASGVNKNKKSKKRESREGETKQERKMRRAARRARKAQKLATKESKKATKKEAKRVLKETETKEERRARRIERRARKEAKRSKRGQIQKAVS